MIGEGYPSLKENYKIYERWFSNAYRYLFRTVDKTYGISKKILCDVGCVYGANLFYCASD